MNFIKSVSVTLLTLATFGCAFISPLVEEHFQESCQSHAYTQTPLLDYIQNRFRPNSPVRIGVMPAITQANMNHFYYEYMNGGLMLANRIQQDLLNWGTLPIVEVFNRPEWPGKKEEFFSGNFNSIKYARNAGYDFVVVSFVEPMRNTENLSALVRVIDTSSGVSVYYGKSTAHSMRQDYNRTSDAYAFGQEIPSQIPTNDLFEKLGQCVSQAIMKESSTPK
jgi:hypothetical protein